MKLLVLVLRGLWTIVKEEQVLQFFVLVVFLEICYFHQIQTESTVFLNSFVC